MDHGTASAAEVFALSLRDNLGTPLYGEHTYGKGRKQVIHQFAKISGRTLLFKHSTHTLFGPKHSPIDGQGLIPDHDLSEVPSEILTLRP